MGKRVIEQLKEKCLEAYRAEKPILYVYTDESELMYELIRSCSPVDLLVRDGKSYVRYDSELHRGRIPVNYCEGLQDCYYDWSGGPGFDPVFPLNPEKWKDKGIPHITLARGEELQGEMIQKLDRYVRYYLKGDGSIRRSTIILYSCKNYMPEFLYPYTEFIKVEFPDREEIRQIIDQETGKNFLGKREELLGDFTGFEEREIRSIIRRIYFMNDKDFNDSRKIRDMIFRVKSQLIMRENILELVDADRESEEMGGQDRLMDYLKGVKESLLNAELRESVYGAGCPKGILVCGVPGCGKSMAAKHAAHVLGLPLLKMDVGNLLDSLLGESEHNMKKALELAEAMSPCILLIDELDKAFSSARIKSMGNDGTFKRMFASMLTWMQEHTKPCFLFATANDLTGFPPEFFRSGRFDMVFGVYLPTRQECVEILKTRLKFAKRRAVSRLDEQPLFSGEWYKNDEDLAEIIGLFASPFRALTGADIAKMVNQALQRIADEGHYEKRPIGKQKMKDVIGHMLQNRELMVYGDSEMNMEQAADCCKEMFLRQFVPVSSKALYDAYRLREDGVIDAETADSRNLSDYDRELLKRMGNKTAW